MVSKGDLEVRGKGVKRPKWPAISSKQDPEALRWSSGAYCRRADISHLRLGLGWYPECRLIRFVRYYRWCM